MRIDEFQTPDEISTGFYDPAKDEQNIRRLSDTRKPTLTLAALNRLKRMRALKKLEKLKRQDLLGVMYGAPDDAGAPGGMPGF